MGQLHSCVDRVLLHQVPILPHHIKLGGMTSALGQKQT